MKKPMRVGLVVGTNPELIEKYIALHSDQNEGVRALLQSYHIRNFSIFIRKMDDEKEYLFGYYEYVGDNYEEDMRKLAEDPQNIEWLKMCDPCQRPLRGEQSWANMKQIFYND